MGSPRAFAVGDLNAFFALLLDNVVNLVVLAGILAGAFGFPAEFVVTRMVPGTALGVLVGDLLYALMAVRASRRTGRPHTAMPLGLDTPSTIGIAIVVIGPVFAASKDPVVAWEVGMATLVLMGVAKVVLSFAGDAVLRVVPRAGLLGPIAGVGLALLGLFPLVRIFSAPVAGLVATGIVLYALVARRPLPGRIPGALAAVAAGTAVWWAMRALGLEDGGGAHGAATIGVHLPLPEPGRVLAGLPRAVEFLPVAVPFGLLTIVGGINVTESARVAGDEYRTRDVLLVEAFATLAAGLCGGVAQSTPYIGHPAYKAMGARSGYVIATALAVGVGGALGVLGALVDWLPEVAVAPILLFVGLEITVQAFSATERDHLPAAALAVVPVIAYLVSIYTDQLIGAGAKPNPALAAECATVSVLGRGFILTAMLWGAAAAFLQDRRAVALLIAFAVLAAFSLFGVVHSVHPAGALYLPDLADPRPLRIAAAYALTGGMLAALTAWSARGPGKRSVPGRAPSRQASRPG
ncbi:MAG: MFS transporter [Deltaproteobacteria bacterium]|nr:MFS transporter [Deltaproteobacteria bacterium]